MYGSVVCTPPTRRSVYTYKWKCIEVYIVYTSVRLTLLPLLYSCVIFRDCYPFIIHFQFLFICHVHFILFRVARYKYSLFIQSGLF